MTPPSVSVVIPCRNEERFIGECLDSLVSGDYPRESLEILVVDGMSDDGTRRIIEDYGRRFPFVRRIDNPKMKIPAALNIGVAAAEGQIILRFDAHSIASPGHVRKLVEALERHDADLVGCRIETRPYRPCILGNAIALAISSRFGVGNSHFRTGTSDARPADTVFGGSFRKELFERVRGYDESIPYSEDLVFNWKVRKAGGRIVLDPGIVSIYRSRSDLGSFVKQTWRNGMWSILPLAYLRGFPLSLRHLVPLAFVLSIVVSSVAAPFSPWGRWAAGGIGAAYALSALVASVVVSVRAASPCSLVLLPMLFPLLHITYGLGSLWAVMTLPFRQPSPPRKSPP